MTYGDAPHGMRIPGVPRSFTRFSDDELAEFWTLSGMPGAYPGRVPMARFLEPIPNSWRDIAYRALRTGDRGRALALMLAILWSLTPRVSRRPAWVPSSAPAPRRLNPRLHTARIAPARAP